MRRSLPAEANWKAPSAWPSTVETDMLPYLGQLNPVHENRLMFQRGRMLSGLGSNEVPDTSTVDPTPDLLPIGPADSDLMDSAAGEIQMCEEEDDVVGSSGIFDPPARASNINPDMGVFSANYNVPGFISREELFKANKSIVDSPNGGGVAFVAGGGAYYVDKSDLDSYSEPFGPAANRQAAPPSAFQSPSYWWPTEYPAVTQGPTMGPFEQPPPPAYYGDLLPDAPYVPAPFAPMPERHYHGGTRRAAGTSPRAPMPYTGGFAPAPSASPAPTGVAPYRGIMSMHAPRKQQRLAGLGAADSGPTTGQIVLAGALVGAGLAMVYTALTTSQR